MDATRSTPPEPDGLPRRDAPAPGTGSPLDILLADDEAEIRKRLGDALVAAGYTVRTAASAEAALAELRRRPADLLITDLQMEGHSGLDLIRAARALHPELDAVLVTGDVNLESAIAAAKLRLLDFVEKPFRVSQILAAVARCRPGPRGQRH